MKIILMPIPYRQVLAPQYLLADRLSLAKNWRLQIPDHMYERGIHIHYIDPNDEAANYIADQWYFIEI